MPRSASLVSVALLGAVALGCRTAPAGAGRPAGSVAPPRAAVAPGITVLLDDSLQLVRGKRVGLITNQSGLDEHGRSDIDLLFADPRATGAGVKLVRLFSPEHGIRGTEDHPNVAGGVDEKTGLPIVSLYTTTAIAPPDSALRDLDVLVFDLQDVGTRTWTYVGTLIYSMRAAARSHVPIVVLDRPNPLTGVHDDPPMLDSALANAEEDQPGRPALPYALFPFPLRHSLTMAEMARFYDATLGIGAELHVVPMRGWRRTLWFDETGLPWVKPSPNLPSLTSELVYPALVAFEGSNLSVGRGTPLSFQRFGAPWLDAAATARLLEEQGLAGVRFEAERFTPVDPPDRKYGGQSIPGVRIVVVDRDRVNVGRVGAAILWAVAKTGGDSLKLRDLTFDRRFGNPALREALLRGEDPDAVIDREVPKVAAFEQRVRPYLLYR